MRNGKYVVKENVEDCRPKGIRYNVTFVEDIRAPQLTRPYTLVS